jgi:hypothetical protein
MCAENSDWRQSSRRLFAYRIVDVQTYHTSIWNHHRSQTFAIFLPSDFCCIHSTQCEYSVIFDIRSQFVLRPTLFRKIKLRNADAVKMSLRIFLYDCASTLKLCASPLISAFASLRYFVIERRRVRSIRSIAPPVA